MFGLDKLPSLASVNTENRSLFLVDLVNSEQAMTNHHENWFSRNLALHELSPDIPPTCPEVFCSLYFQSSGSDSECVQ